MANQKPICDTIFTNTFLTDTILPSDYLMAYPGSWWEYSDGRTMKCTDWAYIPTYAKVYNADYSCLEIKSEYKYMPWIESTIEKHTGDSYAIHGNYKVDLDSTNYASIFYKQILPFGEEWHYYGETKGSGDYTYEYRNWYSCDSVFETKLINGNLYEDVIYIHQRTIQYFYHTSNGPFSNRGYYFAKNIGLVKIKVAGNYPGIYERYLLNYYIAPH